MRQAWPSLRATPPLAQTALGRRAPSLRTLRARPRAATATCGPSARQSRRTAVLGVRAAAQAVSDGSNTCTRCWLASVGADPRCCANCCHPLRQTLTPLQLQSLQLQPRQEQLPMLQSPSKAQPQIQVQVQQCSCQHCLREAAPATAATGVADTAAVAAEA